MIVKPARLLLALCALAAAPAFAQTAVTVNGKAIPSSRIDQMVQQVVASGKQPDSPQLREAAKKELINREVLVQEADKQGYGTHADVKAAIETARQGILISAMMNAYVKAEYDKVKAANMGTEYHARHILVDNEAQAKDIIAKLKAGAKFEDLAKQSKDGSASNGGDLGWMTPNKLVKPFADAMVALKPGQLTDTPVKTEFGYHVIKLEESRPVQVPPLEQVKGRIEEMLQQQKAADYRDELMKKAVIK